MADREADDRFIVADAATGWRNVGFKNRPPGPTSFYRRQRRKHGWGEYPSKRITQELPRMLEHLGKQPPSQGTSDTCGKAGRDG